MAVYTKINKEDIFVINNKFDIEKIISFQGIKKGIENTNYLLKSKNKKFILTIFEKRVSNKEIPFFMKLMDQLNYSKINCPKPLKSNNGSYLIELKNKTACIVSFLQGKDKNKLSLKNCFEVGKIIAKRTNVYFERKRKL
jgi:homoserine kinase type II